jgi:hypothetical protein
VDTDEFNAAAAERKHESAEPGGGHSREEGRQSGEEQQQLQREEQQQQQREGRKVEVVRVQLPTSASDFSLQFSISASEFSFGFWNSASEFSFGFWNSEPEFCFGFWTPGAEVHFSTGCWIPAFIISASGVSFRFQTPAEQRRHVIATCRKIGRAPPESEFLINISSANVSTPEFSTGFWEFRTGFWIPAFIFSEPGVDFS